MNVDISTLTDPVTAVRRTDPLQQLLLEESLREHGQLTPLVVCRDGTIIDGYRRWLAARTLGWSEVAVNYVEGDPYRLRIICQTQQSEFGQTERRVLLNQYLERDPTASLGKVAHDLKWAPADIEQLCCLGFVIKPVIELFNAGKVTLAAAWAMGRLLEHAQIQVFDQCDNLENLQEDAEEHLRVVKHDRRRAMTTRPRVKSYGALEKEMQRPVYAGPELIACNAKSPLDGWIAALKWAVSSK